MISAPAMVMLGSAARQVGKTEFACALIRRAAAAGQAPIGIKITTITSTDQTCPRGGSGCGACHTLHGAPFWITEETDTTAPKDTARMLRAGAARVLWLRTRREALAESVPALLAGLPPDQPLICESNSARTVITPGCFLILRRADDPEIKASCRQVLSLADRLITIQGRQWDTSPDDLTFAGGHWWWRQEATAIILAGGQSRRMGQDKSMLDFGGQPLIAHIAGQVRPHFRHLLIGANAPDRYAFLDAPVIADQLPGQGPLMGLASCLAAAPTEFVFLTGCDIPTADTRTIYALLAALEHQDAVIPVTPDGQRHPLFAAYRRTPALTAARAALADGRRRMAELPARLRVAWYEIGAAPWFRNLNTPEEYAAVRATSQGTATP